MGCFLSCFRTGSDRSSDLHDPLVVESRLGDAFLDDGKKLEANGRLEEDAGDAVGIDEELRQEANYLKSCGAISQTPPEILKVSSPVSAGDINEHNDISSNAPVVSREMLFEVNSSELFNSEMPDISRHQENQAEDTTELNEASINAQTMSEAMLSEGNSSELFKTEELDILRKEGNITESSDTQTDEHGIVDAESETLSSLQDKTSCQKFRNQTTGSSDSPFPTPLVLRDDIQTPGTVYTALTSKAGKRARGRQFIYPVLRPIENKLQWMEVKLDSPMLSDNPSKRRYLSPGSSENPQEISPSSAATKTELPKSVSPIHDNSVSQNDAISPEESKVQSGNEQLVESGELSKQNSEHGKHGVSSLSYWLKTSSTDDKNQSDIEGSVGKEPFYEKSSFDVPIFATSGLNWDNDNPTPILPKAWDGNGIPNTTTKYKEDRVVSWHATPFEERLLKVLTSEKPSLERKISGKLIHLEENAE